MGILENAIPSPQLSKDRGINYPNPPKNPWSGKKMQNTRCLQATKPLQTPKIRALSTIG
jgi:hypothetical protein